jgi:Zn-finger nucleic acid-binding protein
MKCPKDNSALFPQEYEGGIYADVCTSCRGMWLDRGELEKTEETAGRDYSEELSRIPDLVGGAYEKARQKTRKGMPCPKCGGVMERKEYAYCSQVMIDKCPKCGGVWLDRGEVEALEIFYERSRKEAGKLRRSFLEGLTSHFRHRRP